ncbi:uncharacterized membrane protein HdeD (DUF308 family) [Spinactinospora alkalitolerans]|uniref:Uncharacterized membrane protein HdeD (DUF308 family) n=1 Tax=Spinactinospora alkalitolerans TaxID=687207 RepID=A0A852TSS7_9ACTN|nr:hypothetical protein [Spinactinospora alkalitolerans]NYE45793.1 uncharacterized membrane protein HdeD (DUF308 family) [Spinactinospora alkalitolerans]
MSRRPLTITLAAALEALLGLALAAGGLFILFSALFGRTADADFPLPLAILGLGAAAALGYVAWGLYTLHDWARTPVVLTQVFALVVAYYMWTSQQYALSIGLGAIALAALALTLAPPTTATLFPDETGSAPRSKGN